MSELFHWHANFATGIKSLDLQYQRFITHINQIALGYAKGASEATLKTSLDTLLDLLKQHFVLEAQIWQEVAILQDDPCAAHVLEHEQLHTHLGQLNLQPDSLPEILTQLLHWLTTHVLQKDQQMALVVIARRSGLSVMDAHEHGKQQLLQKSAARQEMLSKFYLNICQQMFTLVQQRRKHGQLNNLPASVCVKTAQQLQVSQQALQRQKRILKQAQAIARIGYWELDHQNNCLSWSDEVYSILGLEKTTQVLTYQDFLKLLTPKDRTRIHEAYQRHLYDQKPYDVTHEVMSEDGSSRYVHQRCETHFDIQGHPVHSLGVVADISGIVAAEQAARDGENKYKALFELAPISMIAINAQQDIIMINAACARKLGYTLKNIANFDCIWSLLFPDVEYRRRVKIRWMHALEEALHTDEGICPFDVKLRCGDGVDRHFELGMVKTCFFDIVILVDVSERHEVQNELFKARELLEQAGRMARFGAFELDIATHHYHWSPVMREIYGLDKHVSVNQDTIVAFCKPGYTQDNISTLLNRAITTGAPFDTETQIITTSGQECWVRIWCKTEFANGHCVRLYGTVQDITSHKQTEAALKASEMRYRILVQAAAQALAIWETDAQGMVVEDSASWRAFTGQTLKQWLGMGWLDAVHPDDREQARRSWFDGVAHGINIDAEFRVQTPEGAWRWTNVLASPIMDSNGQIVKWVSMSRDISERKLVEEERIARQTADAANRDRNAFLANMSHELRTPLNGILGFCQILARDITLNSKQNQQIQTITRCAKHLLMLVNDILDITNIQAGHQDVQSSDFKLQDLIHDLDGMFSALARSKGLALYIHSAKNVPQYIHADVKKLRQVLVNLITNAIKFTASGSVAVKFSLEDNVNGLNVVPPQNAPFKLWIEVRDTGPGIDPKDRERIFKPFQQSEAGTRAGGTGLGLAISYHMVQLMGGEIELLTPSFEAEKGSCFRFNINALNPMQDKFCQLNAKHADIFVSDPFIPPVAIAYSLDPYDIKHLSEGLLQNMRQALLEGDILALREFIVRVRQTDQNLGQQLDELALKYEYEKLAQILQR